MQTTILNTTSLLPLHTGRRRAALLVAPGIPIVITTDNIYFYSVPRAGIEPAPGVARLDFESSASTNFTTSAIAFQHIADSHSIIIYKISE
jgi:hypothetical protein